MAWTSAEGDRVADWVLRLRHRAAIETTLARTWSLRGAETGELVTYVGPHIGGWLRVRYANQLAIGAAFTSAIPRQGEA